MCIQYIVTLGLLFSSILARPLRTEFENFIVKYHKVYEAMEYQHRYNIFEENYWLIRNHNNNNLSWKLELNEWADLTWDEFKEQKFGLFRAIPQLKNTAHIVNPDSTEDIEELPVSLDWRSKGVVNVIKDQQQCGSCWAFSAIGAIESAYAIKTGTLYSLSEQQLVDCSSSYGNYGCSGGLMDQAFHYVQTNGLCLESDYPYTAADGTCLSTCEQKLKITGFADVPSGNETALQFAVVKQPISVAIEADQAGFQFYSSGIFDGVCGTNLDHGVVLEGYGTEDGKDYWLIRNSWGVSWGDSGYIKIIRGKNQCGILLEPSYPII